MCKNAILNVQILKSNIFAFLINVQVLTVSAFFAFTKCTFYETSIAFLLWRRICYRRNCKVLFFVFIECANFDQDFLYI